MNIPGKIISGGQTGVDRAALNFARERGIAWGGWAPKGWRSEDGAIPEEYRERMREHSSPDYLARTLENVRDGDATLIVVAHHLRTVRGGLIGGTARTAGFANREAKPLLVVDIRSDGRHDQRDVGRIRAWWTTSPSFAAHSVLNIAGPRESKAPGIYAATLNLLREVWP